MNPAKRVFSGTNVLPLVGATLFVFFYLLLLLSFDYIKFLNDSEAVIIEGSHASHKMRLNSELMEIARARTRITNQIIDIDDPFEQDELNLELDRLAGKFAALREELLGMDLNQEEREILLEDHPIIVSTILPAQRRAVDLAMSDSPEDRRLARDILYKTVFPGQGQMVDSLGRMITLEQQRIEEISNRALTQSNKTKKRSYIMSSLAIGITLIASILVLLHIRKIQNALRAYHQNLEHTVEERTEELSGARDELQRYVDLVDKYIITSHTNEHGIINYTSEAFCEISQYDEFELIGRPHSIVRHPDMPGDIYEDLWRTIKQGESWRGEIKNRAKDGSAYWVDVNIEPQFDDDGKITGYFAVRQDITDKKRIEELSITDSLTQLYNRLKLDESLFKEVERANRYQRDLSIILFDVDHFKKVNDSYGHQAGDAVLIDIAYLLKQAIRSTDVAGRWGGEEFLVICPDTELEGATELSERIRTAIAEHGFEGVGNVTSSFGVARLMTKDSVDDLLADADAALYRAKDGGRNRVAVA